MNNVYAHFYAKTMNPASMIKSAYQEARRSWLCTGCCTPKPGVPGVDVRIQDQEPEGPLNSVAGCGVSLATRMFLKQFGWDRVIRHFNIGKVIGPDGQTLDE
jgi:hypothetical protein